MERIETTILRSLAYHDEYSRKVLPFIRVEYFTDYTEKVVFEEICKFIFKYNKLPNEEILRVEVDNRTDLNESTYKEVCLLYTSPSPRDLSTSRMPSSA